MYVKLLTNNFLSEKAVGKSESKDVHLAVLRVLPEVIRESVDAERHADYRKGEGGKGTEGERRDAGRIVAVNQGKRDGSGVDADASSKSVIIYDPATGEKKMVSPTAVDGIESLGEVKTAEQREAEINAHMQDTIQRSKDWLEGNVANPVGMQIQLGDGRIATIEAMHEDGKSAIATLPDGTQFLVPNDVLQRIVNNGQYADYKARRDAEASKRDAEQSTESAPETATEGGQPLPEEASPKEEERREYAQGDELDVVVEGQKMHAEIVSPKDADGRFVVNVDDGESMRTLYVTPEELAAMEYREEPSPKAEETRLATEDSSDKAFERGAQPTEEHTPTALERIPRDEKGNAQFHDVDTETAWDGLVEMSGNEETAHKVAEASLANAERKLKAAKALKEEGETPEELLRSIKENEAAAAEAQRTVDAWKAIVGEKSRREEASKAEVERIERKAAEERERAEAEEKTRIEAEKKEAERIAAEKAEEEARVEAERKAEEERKTKEEERKERDENGQPFVVSSDGTTTFGEITEDTGLTAAPIKLSEGVADEKGNGYGLRHIEARHGDQIRKAGFSSVEEFIEQVAKNYDVIKEGSDRNGNKTYRLLLTDKHNNTLMIELSKDGSYWNVNTAGVFKKSYGKDKKEVYNRHTTVKQSAETAETSQADEHSGTQSTSRMNVPTTSADKGSEISEEKQGKEQGKMDVVDVDNPQSWVGHTFTGIKGLFKGQQFVCEGLDGDKAVFHLKTADDDFKFSITKMRDMFARGWLRVENADLKRGNESVFDIAAAIAKKEGKEAAERQERMDGYTADMPPMRRARVRKTLGKELNYRNFGVMTEGEFVESMVAAGGIVTADFHNGKMRRLIDINDGELGYLKYPVSKAAADYAVYLGAKVNESELVNAKTEARMHEIRRKYADEDERGMFDNEEWLDREIGNSSRDKRKQERYEDLTEYKKLKEERDAKFNAHLRKSEKKQEKQSVFDKAKEIADKEEKKRKAEADKPKQKPLTEAERKDAEEVAGALGYRVEWVDTMEENGTIDADKKVIRIANDAENPLVQVLGHEVAHGVKRMDGGKFKALQKAAMEVVGEKEWNERIEKKRKLNAYAEGKLAEEVTCDIVGEALNDKDALKRLAESLRGERGILARLRDAVVRMVEYFKNRGDKEGVRRMKAADKLLAEFESALKEGVAPEQVKPEDVDRSVRESRDEPENKRRKDFAERFGVDESYVSDYANGMAQKKTGKAARARRSMERQIYLANAGKTSKLSDIAKSLKPFRAALKEAFGDLDALIDEYRKLFEEERNMMEAARKKAEDEAAARKRHLDELSLLTDGQIDSRYAEALEKGDETEAREMLDEVARRKGYGDENNEYRMQHRAPSNPGYESDEARRNDIENGPDVNLEDIALGYNRQPDDYFTNPRGYGNDTPHGRESTDAVANALSSIRQGGRDVTVKVYRAVPTTMKEGKLRNGDWVSLSRRYAEMHGNHALNGKYRIMEDEVPAKDIWWDGNDVNEFGYDNGEDYKYKNVKNNRKSDDLVTRDDKGNVIPPSKRFNQRKADERYSRRESKALTAEERELRDNLVERMRKGGLDVVTDSEEMQRVIDTENERTRNKRSKKSEAARKRDEALYAVDWSTAFVSGKSREEATEIRRERGRKFKEETKELYGRVLSGNFDDVTLRLIDKFVDNSTPNNPYERPISKRLPARALQKMRGRERTGSIDALFSRISESAVGKDGKALPRAERERAIEEKKKELLKKWAIATGNWHTDVSDFSDGKEPIGSGTDSDVYLSKDGKSVIKVSKGKPYGKRFRPDVDNVALFNTVFPGSRYTIEGYGEIDGKFVRFLKQPIVDFTSSTPLTEGERVAYMEKLGFKPINKENTAFSNGEIIASDLQKSNIVKDKQGNVRVIDADMKLHTKDFGGKFSYPDAETDTRTAGGEVYTGSVREHRVYHGSGADFDAFDHSHMGEGEGAQAYGWGTYVTEVEGIGRTYAIQNTTKHNDALRALQHDVDAISDQLNRHRDDLKYDEEQLKRANEWRAEAELDYELFKDEAEKLKEKYGESSPEYQNHLFYDIYTDEMKRAQSSVKSTEESIQYRKEKIAELEKALKDKQAEIDELPKEFPRHLYTVEIPDDNGSNYLDWNGHPAESLLKGVGSFLESNGFERVQDSPVRYEKGESTVVLNPNATGADLYAELREALGSDKKASQALAELGCIGIKYPADNMRGGRKDGAKNYVIFNENDAKITDHTRFLRTASGEVYGLVKDGRIYLDSKVATAETAVHEYTHLWGDMLRRKDSEQWSRTVKELKNSVLWEEVKESYPELKTDDEIADEVLSTFSGRRGAERLREEARRVAEGDGGVFTKAKAIETLERVKEAIARFWEGVARMFGINRYRSAEELADMAMKDLLDSKNPIKDESGMRKRGEVGETLATSGTYFSGGGLLEAGLKGVIDPKVAVEFSEKIAGVYADNHGNHIVVADVRDVDPKKLVGAVDGGEVQYFHASPVCKNFSKAKREGGEVELDKETALSTAEFIAKTRPKVVTIENVKGYRNSEALKIITDELTRQGYDWDADVYNAADYGGYTKRERLIVRAKRDGKLPPKPEKLPEELRKKGWYSAVEDLIPHLEEKKTGVPQGTDERLKNSGIDYRTIDKPLYVFGRGYANKTVGHAFADELLPTLTTGGGDIIIMPDGRVLKASPRVLARVTGLPDTYKMPETDQLSHTIVGNGIPTQLTEGVIAPLLDNAIPSAERATKRESVFDVADRVSQNLEERTRAMGSRVEKRMADVAQKLEGKELSMEQKAVVDVFSGEKDNQKFSVERNGVKQQFLLKQGQEDKAGAKHSLYRHYGTNTGVITADDVLKIPQVLERGERIEKAKGGKKMAVYTMDIDGVKYTVLTRVGKNNEIVDDFYSNKKGSESSVYRNVENIDNTPEGARRKDSEPSAKVEDKSESPKLFGEEIIDDGKKGSDSIDRSVRENPKNEDKPRFSRKPGESIFDYASRVSEDVDRSVRERVSARDEYEKKVKSKGFQTKEALQNSMLGLQEFMSAIDHASGNKRYIEDIPDFENPILGENRLSSVNKEEMHQVAKTQFKPLMSAVAKLSGNGKESGELYDYMFAKHGLERDAVMRQREAQKEFDKYQKANPKGTKTIGDFVASLEGKDYAGLTALTAEDGRVKSIQSQIDAIDEQMKATDDQLLLRKLGGQKKRLKVDLLNAARDAADDIRKTFENNPSHDRSDINELWSRVNEVNGNTLRKLYESGMLTKEAYNDISSMYTNYIPMRGFDQTTSADAYAYLTHGDSAFNAPIKTAKGRSSKADNPIAYMQAMAESAIMQGNRNVLVKQKMLNFVRNHPSDLASVSDVWLQYDSVADEWKPVFPDNIGANDSASVVAKKMEAFEDKMKQMAEKHPDLVMRSNEAPDIPYKVVEKGQLNEHQVLVKQNGKSYIITVNGSPRAAQAANGLTNPDTDFTGAVGKVLEGAEALNRQLSSLYTTFKPGFVGSNYVRDALYSNTMVYVKEGAKYGGSFNLNFAKYNPAEMANLYARYNKGSLDTSNETHRLFLEFMQNGGETGFVNLKQIEKRKSEIAKAIKRDGRISAERFFGGLNNAFDFANKSVENSARFAAYVTSRKSGRSVGRSVYDAKEISVNFNRKGSGRNWWKDNVGTSRFYDTEIGLVEINRASVGSSLAHRYSQVKLDVITSLAEGFNNAVYFGSMQDFSRQEGVKSHYFAYPINYNGNRNYVFCRAMQDANKSRLYVHEVFLADNIEKGNTLQTAASQPHGGITLYKDILANVLAANVTNDSETSKPCFSRKPGESIFDYASRVSEDVDRSVCEGR